MVDLAVTQTGHPDGRVELNFADNLLLAPLFGEYSQNLERIESHLGVKLISHGNRLVIDGADATARGQARDVLVELYDRLQRGHDVELGDVDGALRMAARLCADLPIAANPVAAVPAPRRIVDEELRIQIRKRILAPRSPGQAHYIRQLKSMPMVFALGPAGTGKTYLAVAQAVACLLDGSVDRIVLSRPAVEAGENLGFLPGDMRDKVDPYLRPLYDALYDLLPPDQVERRFRAGEIEIAPLAFMRGRTLANAFIILDEAQNASRMQMKMFLTRFGHNARMVIAGDPSQVDLPPRTQSGLIDAVRLLTEVEDVGMVRFSAADVVRHPLVGRIVDAYARDGGEQV
ncbi:MAG: PhoH family protein [Sphingomonadales bacterium]